MHISLYIISLYIYLSIYNIHTSITLHVCLQRYSMYIYIYLCKYVLIYVVINLNALSEDDYRLIYLLKIRSEDGWHLQYFFF